MAIVFAWGIAQLETAVSEDGLTDVVKTAHWTFTATEVDGDKTYVASSYSSIGFGAPDPQDFTAYAGLTFDEVVSWIKTVMGQEQVDAMEEALANNIELQKHPKIVNLPLPWVQSPPSGVVA
jgi:hypothetical protein